MNEGVPIDKVSARIKDIIKTLVKGNNEAILLHPMSQWHLYNEFKNGQVAGGRIRLVRIFGIIGAFVLLLACINFMNLSTGRSARRAERGRVRKNLVALREGLFGLFLCVAFLLGRPAFLQSVG